MQIPGYQVQWHFHTHRNQVGFSNVPYTGTGCWTPEIFRDYLKDRKGLSATESPSLPLLSLIPSILESQVSHSLSDYRQVLLHLGRVFQGHNGNWLDTSGTSRGCSHMFHIFEKRGVQKKDLELVDV